MGNGYADYREEGPCIEPSGDSLVKAAAVSEGRTIEQIDQALTDHSLRRMMGRVRGEDRPVTAEEDRLLDLRLEIAAEVHAAQ